MRKLLVDLSVPVVVSLLFLLCSSVAGIAEEKENRQPSRKLTVSERFFKRLEEAHRYLGEEKYAEAAAVLDQMAGGRRSKNDHEVALMWQARGFLHSGQAEYDKAIDAFEKCLALQALPDATAMSTRYNLAQLYVVVGRHPDAIRELENWIARTTNPPGDAYYLLAVAHAQANDYERALAPAAKAVASSQSPREPWLQMLAALRLDKKQYAETVPLLEQLVQRFPKKTYWLQLSAVYMEVGRPEEGLATMRLAYDKGLLTEDKELRNLAVLYLNSEIPLEAARVLEKGLAEKRIKQDAEAWELLANSWLFAKEPERAVEPLRQAAAMRRDGSVYVRLAQVFIEREQWDEAEKAAHEAITKGSLQNPGDAQLLVGVANYNARRVEAARRAFAEAGRYDASRDAAGRWLQHIEKEQARS